MRIRLSTILFFFVLAPVGHACSWSYDYFFQVSKLRGSVVGVNRGDPRQMVASIRHQVKLSGVRLKLRRYEWPVKDLDRLSVIKTALTDKRGYFDFGALPPGHYFLTIDTPWGWEDVFTVEVKRPGIETASVVIDISPNFPDCTGGHEFIIQSK